MLAMALLCSASMVAYSLHCDLSSFFFVLGDVSVLVSTGPIIENKRVQVGLCDSSLEVGHSNVSAGASEAERLQRQSHLDVGKHDWHTGEGEVPVSNQLMGL